MLARDLLHVASSPLRLLGDAQGLGLNAHDPDTALEQPLIEVLCSSLEGEITRTQHGRPVEAKDIARFDLGHQEGQTELIACSEQVGFVVKVGRDEVRLLRGEVGEQFEEGLGHFQWGVEGRGHGLFGDGHIGAGLRDGVGGGQETRLLDRDGSLGSGSCA